MRSIKTLLVAVKDPEARSLPGLEKAVQIARGLHAKLELFHALSWPIYANSDAEFHAICASERARVIQRLERLAVRIHGRGRCQLRVSISAAWDHPAYEAVIRRAMAIHADLIVAERHLDHPVTGALIHFNDWELLRQSPVPVLLIKRPEPYRKPAVLAAVESLPLKGRPPELERKILDAGTALAAALKGALHSVHALHRAGEQLSSGGGENNAADLINRRRVAAVRKRYDRVLDHYDVPPVRRHLANSFPAEAIETVVGGVHAQIVVIGTLSHTGWRSCLIDNTAETAFDLLQCDLLTMKPTKFTNAVETATRGARLLRVASPMVA